MKSLNSLVSFLLFGFFSMLILSPSFGGDILTDSLALVALYDSTDGANWTTKTGWKTDTLGAWYGITKSNGRVSEIKLDYNNLNGSIPSQIGDLENLTRLILDHNLLSDSIPPEIGNLSNLVYLRLNSNDLTGHIPPEIGNLTNLGQLYLGDNNLEGNIPNEIANLTNAWDLYLSQNSLTGPIPAVLGNMTNLQLLYLDYNNLTGGIPVELGDIPNLFFLSLSGNPLGGTLPPQLGTMVNLMELSLNDCQLTGSIPAELANISNLQTLALSFNQLEGSIPAGIGDLLNLRVLNIYNNQLSGEIPPELGNLTNLQQLSLSSNGFTGSIPPELGNLENLYYFEVYGNELTGSIPPELGNLNSLWSFIVSENHLTGSIPAELGNLTNLTRFYVQNNELSGAVPEELSNLSQLNYLHIRNNRLEDLPDLSDLTSLIQFYAENNKFTFGDLEPNIYVLNAYAPQDSIGVPDTLYYVAGDTIGVATQTDGLYNNYQWQLNGGNLSDNSLYSGANDSLLLIRNPLITDAGMYSCDVTNDTVTGLTLHSYPITLLPTVKITSLPSGIQCNDSSISVGYKSIEVTEGNIFTVELSDSKGNFKVPVEIGNFTGTDSIGTILCYIPDTIPSGDQYRLRVNASSPSITGLSSEENLVILNGSLPNPVLTPAGNASICEGESIFIHTDSTTNLQYIWYRNDIIIADATNHWLDASEEGTYYVEIFNACSTDSFPSNTINITANPLPAISLTLDGTLLTATQDVDYSYTWYKDGIDLMLDESTYEYTATENGVYYVMVTDENGCTNTSNSQEVSSISGLDNILEKLDIFPNPTNEKVFIVLKGNYRIKRITVFRMAGEIIYDETMQSQNTEEEIELDLYDQNAGLYMIRILTNTGPLYFKLIKTGI